MILAVQSLINNAAEDVSSLKIVELRPKIQRIWLRYTQCNTKFYRIHTYIWLRYTQCNTKTNVLIQPLLLQGTLRISYVVPSHQVDGSADCCEPPLMEQKPLVGRCLLILEVKRPHSDTPHSVGLLWTGDQPDAETSN